MNENIDNHQDLQSLFVEKNLFLSKLFSNDYDAFSVAKVNSLKRTSEGRSYSIFLSSIYDRLREYSAKFDQYPHDPPYIEEDNYFHLDEAIDWIKLQIEGLPNPFLGYFHLMPPHRPYSPRLEFFDLYKDDSQVFLEKPEHLLGLHIHPDGLYKQRRKYDQFLLNVDDEIGRLIDSLKNNGALENTWIFITSDHGQMFERGTHGHDLPFFFDPVIRVPLVILPPGNDRRIDIHSPTAAVDILPTLLKITNQAIPDFLEGEVMPPFREDGLDQKRSIYAVDARHNEQDEPLTESSVMLLKDDYKLIYYFGYEKLPDNKPFYELYHLQNDPEELDDLSSKEPGIAASMLEEITRKIEEKDEPYI